MSRIGELANDSNRFKGYMNVDLSTVEPPVKISCIF